MVVKMYEKLVSIFFTVIMVFGMASNSAFALADENTNRVLALSHELSPIDPLAHAYIWTDESAEWTIEEFLLISAAQPADHVNLVSGNMGVGSSAYWMTINVVSGDDSQWFIESQFPGMDEVSIFRQTDEGSWTEDKAGRNIGKVREDFSQLGVAFQVDLKKGQPTKLILRFRNMGTSLLQLSIYDEADFLKTNANRLHFKYLFLGFMFAMLAYNFILYLATGNQGLQWYLIFQMVMIAFQISGNAIHLHYLPQWAIPQSAFDYNFLALLVLTVPAIFFEKFIGRKKISRGIILGVRIVAVINLLGLPVLLLSSVGLLSPFSIVYFLLVSSVLSGSSYLLLFSIHAFQSRSVDSYIFVAAWFLSFCSLFVQAIVFGGGAKPSNLMTSIDEILVLAESIILATGISIRINSKLAASVEARERLVESQLNEIAALQQSDLDSQKLMRELQHELRTPVGAIVGLTSELRDKSSASQFEWERCVDTLEDSGRRLKDLVEDTLKAITSKRSETELTLQSTDLNEVIDQCEILGRLVAKGELVEITTDVDRLTPVFVDRNRMIQVIVNIISNVIHHAQAGQLNISAYQTQSNSFITIRDDGIGIKADQLDRIFTPFYTTNADGGNSGQGLAIARKIVEWHSGALSVESLEGVGTTFEIRIPFEVDMPNLAKEKALQRKVNEVETFDSGEVFTVMVVDDTEANLLVAKNYLRDSFNLVLTQQPESLESIIDLHTPDIILLDLVMPKRSGFEVLADLKHHPKYSSLPVIVVSALTDSDSIERALEMGAVDYIAKPLNRLELDTRINAHLRSRELEVVQEKYHSVLSKLQVEEQNSSTTVDESDIQQRAMLAQLISSCYDAFCEIEPRTVAELAEASGLWTASLDGSRMRARTLEKYMSIETIPARPNWKKVSATANFIITRVEVSESYRLEISKQLEGLIEHRRSHRQLKQALKKVRGS